MTPKKSSSYFVVKEIPNLFKIGDILSYEQLQKDYPFIRLTEEYFKEVVKDCKFSVGEVVYFRATNHPAAVHSRGGNCKLTFMTDNNQHKDVNVNNVCLWKIVSAKREYRKIYYVCKPVPAWWCATELADNCGLYIDIPEDLLNKYQEHWTINLNTLAVEKLNPTHYYRLQNQKNEYNNETPNGKITLGLIYDSYGDAYDAKYQLEMILKSNNPKLFSAENLKKFTNNE